jgi:drug/metabolite transporter (DMT)-like permease
MPWYVAALGAAVVWGLHYPLLDHALKKISLTSALLLTALPILVVALLNYKQVVSDVAVVRQLAPSAQLTIAAVMLTSLVGSALLFLSIGSKNATLASLIEITYPMFVALFAYVLFRSTVLNLSVAIGALLIFAGVAVIILNNR